MKLPHTITLIILVALALVSYFIVPELTFLNSVSAFVLGLVVATLVFMFTTRNDSINTTPANPTLSTLYIGNLPYRIKEQAIKAHFSQYGYVDSVRLLKDRRTGKPKGFGFVEVASDKADIMIKKLNDTIFEERTLKVRLAKDKSED